MYLAGHTNNQVIADRVGLTRQRVHQILKDGLREAADERPNLKTDALDLTLIRLRDTAREARAIVMRRCAVCNGETSECGAEPCKKCKDTGSFFRPSIRLKAMAEYLRVTDQESRLLGLYDLGHHDAPSIPGVSEELLREFQALSEAELDERIKEYDVSIKELEERMKEGE